VFYRSLRIHFLMTDCFPSLIYLPVFKGRKVEVNFEGGDVTSDGGIVLLQQIDQKLGLTEKVAGLPTHL